MDAVAKYQAFWTDGVDERLRDLGYTPPFDRNAWNAFPTVRKIEAAVVAADVASPTGGERVLALLSRALAQEYDAIRYEPALERYLASELPSEVRFSSVAPSAFDSVTVGRVERSAILALSKYADNSGAFGGTAGVLLSHFGLPDDEAYRILRSSDSASVALEQGYVAIMQRVSQSAANARLSQLVKGHHVRLLKREARTGSSSVRR